MCLSREAGRICTRTVTDVPDVTEAHPDTCSQSSDPGAVPVFTVHALVVPDWVVIVRVPVVFADSHDPNATSRSPEATVTVMSLYVSPELFVPAELNVDAV